MSRERLAQILIGNVRSNPDREQAHRDVVADLEAAYLAGVRAGLRAAGEVAQSVAREREEFRAQAEKSGMSISAGGFGHAAYAAGEIATAIAALDAEEVAG